MCTEGHKCDYVTSAGITFLLNLIQMLGKQKRRTHYQAVNFSKASLKIV
jgi:hypothetical protein